MISKVLRCWDLPGLRERQEDFSATALAPAGLEEQSIVGSRSPRCSLPKGSEVASGDGKQCALALRPKSKVTRGISLELTGEIQCLSLLWRVFMMRAERKLELTIPKSFTRTSLEFSILGEVQAKKDPGCV